MAPRHWNQVEYCGRATQVGAAAQRGALLYSIKNIYTFLVVKKATFLSLFVWNTCTPVSIATAAVLLFAKEMRVLSSSMVPLLLWFGFLGLFVFWWGWLDLQLAFLMQGQHLVMTVTAVHLVKTRWTKKGAFVGVVALLPLIASFRVLGPYAAPLWSQARLGLGTEAERYA